MAWKVFIAGAVLTAALAASSLYVEDIAAGEVEKGLTPLHNKLDIIIERQWEHLKGHP